MYKRQDKNLAEHGANLAQDVKDQITAAQADLRAAVEAENLEQVREKINDLQQAVMKIGESLNKGAAGGGAGGEGATYEGEEVKNEDAEKDEEKKEENKQ